jgi:LacI family transcriptional regulator
VTGQSYMIGMVVTDLGHPFFAEVAKGLFHVLRKKGYGLMISASEEDPEIEREEIDRLLARRVDALLLVPMQSSTENLRRLEEMRTPCILIDRHIEGLAASFVGVDDEQIGVMATEHLLEVGCRRIAHLRGPGVSTAAGRCQGYQKALGAHGLTPSPGHIVMGPFGDKAADISGYEAMKQLLRLDPLPDGVFCYDDPVAMGAMQAILEAGLRIPQDIALAGCGNLGYSAQLRVPLTSIDQDSIGIGGRAAKLALKLIETKGAAHPQNVLLTPRLVARESTRKPSS